MKIIQHDSKHLELSFDAIDILNAIFVRLNPFSSGTRRVDFFITKHAPNDVDRQEPQFNIDMTLTMHCGSALKEHVSLLKILFASSVEGHEQIECHCRICNSQ